MIAIKAGGFFGSGAGAGSRGASVPEIGTDMIFALIGEELGLLGMVAVIASAALAVDIGQVTNNNRTLQAKAAAWPGKYDFADILPITNFLKSCLPGVRPQPAWHSVCMYTITPDRHFVVDRHPEWPNVALGCGFSGHGFKSVQQAIAARIKSLQQPVDRAERRRRPLPMEDLVPRRRVLPDHFAGFGIERYQMIVRRGEIQLVLPQSHAAVGRVQLKEVFGKLALVPPVLVAGLGVERNHLPLKNHTA